MVLGAAQVRAYVHLAFAASIASLGGVLKVIKRKISLRIGRADAEASFKTDRYGSRFLSASIAAFPDTPYTLVTSQVRYDILAYLCIHAN